MLVLPEALAIAHVMLLLSGVLYRAITTEVLEGGSSVRGISVAWLEGMRAYDL